MSFYFFNKGPLSQWFPAMFDINGVTYNCAEQYMMAMKAEFFDDKEIQQQIMDTSDPRHQKLLGRQIANFNPEAWNLVARDYVYMGNLAKFSTPRLKNSLIYTGDLELVECNPNDKIWAIGLDIDNPDRFDKLKWQGTNWLGEILMKVRADLPK
jgi:ribA/ribD-fused uncharacterized protein